MWNCVGVDAEAKVSDQGGTEREGFWTGWGLDRRS